MPPVPEPGLELENDYAAAWVEWETSGQQTQWDLSSADGLDAEE